MTAWRTLVSTRQLAARLDDANVVVVDCRFTLDAVDAGEAAYRLARIPRARYAHLNRDLSGRPKPFAGRHPWPEAADFAMFLKALGVSPQHQVVAYDDADGAYAARLWFLLRATGHDSVAVLDGGLAHWIADGLPTEAALPRASCSANYDVVFDTARLMDAIQIQMHLDRGGTLIDARAEPRFRGDAEPIDPVAGHVPGAINRPFALNLHAGRFKSASQLAEEFAALIETRRADEVAVMCGSGVTACHHLLAMEHAGLLGAKLFAGSWSGWVSDPARPIARS